MFNCSESVESEKRKDWELIAFGISINYKFSRSPTSSVNTNVNPVSPEADINERLIVSNDKEGWCRNKKYIENVPNGYRCTVCRKVYGRYNSVSYHVTIYHRNPPIRCGVEGCPFTTREARYIHFHKYYRHGIKLPDSIDLGKWRNMTLISILKD